MWDQRYRQPGYLYGTEPNDFLRQVCAHIPAAGNVLCLAEGEGRNAVFLATQGFRVTAVDQSQVGLDKAHALAHEKAVELETVVADLHHYPLGEQCWDGIVSIWAHVPRDLRQSLHCQVVAALKPGGVFILEAYTPRHLQMSGVGGPPASQQALYMQLEHLQNELAGLRLLWAKELDREVSEGSGHQGMSAVVQIVAEKT